MKIRLERHLHWYIQLFVAVFMFQLLVSLNFCSAKVLKFHSVYVHQPDPKKTVTYKIITATSNTWGYDIYINGVLSVHQVSRPAVPGNLGFGSSADAEKVAKLIVNKIKHNQMPPTISVDEMKKLKVL